MDLRQSVARGLGTTAVEYTNYRIETSLSYNLCHLEFQI